jgi:WD40 repeat protein
LFVGLPRPKTNRAVRVLAINQAGPGLAAGMSDGTIYTCGTVDLKNCLSLRADGPLNDMRFSDEGELVIADRNIRLIKLDNSAPKLVRGDAANYGTVRFDPGQRQMLTINGKGQVMAVDLDSGNVSTVYCCSSIWGEVDFLDNGNQVVWAGHWPGILDMSAAKLVSHLTAQREEMTFGPIAIDPAKRELYMGSQDGRVHRWSIESRKLLSKSTPLSGYVMTISVLGASGWIAYASQPGIVHLWNPETGIHRIVETAQATSNIVFDLQRSLAALGTKSGAIEFWDLPNQRLVETKRLPNSQ